MRRLATLLFLSLGWLLLLPEEAFAWGPATHVALGEAVLRSAALLPPALRAILRRYPNRFLYGSIAADISFAKKYAPVGRHCHHWHVGEEILESADSEELAAVGYGYLAHLAADTIAHNVYVPRKLLLTRASVSVGHTYWEYRMDLELEERHAAWARRLVEAHENSEADELFDAVLSRTLFSFKTNRRIFRGMIAAQGSEQWRLVFDRVVQLSRFELPSPMRDRYLVLAFDSVMDLLSRGRGSRPVTMDPIGQRNLRLAKRLRYQQRPETRFVDPEALKALGDRYFPLPTDIPRYVPPRPTPDLPALRSARAPGEEPPAVAEGSRDRRPVAISPPGASPEGEPPPAWDRHAPGSASSPRP